MPGLPVRGCLSSPLSVSPSGQLLHSRTLADEDYPTIEAALTAFLAGIRRLKTISDSCCRSAVLPLPLFNLCCHPALANQANTPRQGQLALRLEF